MCHFFVLILHDRKIFSLHRDQLKTSGCNGGFLNCKLSIAQ